VDFVAGKPQRKALSRELPELVDEPFALPRRSVRPRVLGDERALPLPHLEQAISTQALVHAQDRVLIDG
jgi:hypothetical protein